MRTLVLAAAIFAPMLGEAVRAARHERIRFAEGGIEPPGDVYPSMRVAYPLTFVVMLVEGVFRGAPPAWAATLGLVIFMAGKALKWWAIFTLGSAWTFRVIVGPAARLVADGPYRYVRHPNYVGVVGELVGVVLWTGAWVGGPLAACGFLLLMWQRLQVEERALQSLQKTADRPPQRPIMNW